MDAVSLQEDYLTGSVDEGQFRKPSQYLWDSTLKLSKETGLYSDIRHSGVQRPVTIFMPTEDSKVLGEGHSRVAAAADLQRKTGKHVYVPMVHDTEDFKASEKN